jgi:UDP-N-acetylmuramate: L-alanyl-gamma-D-glutamyl-meso-diaminopimelate ligase
MHIHILGICGTFMGGIALLAREAGHTVSGSDAHVYPPMSTQLEQAGIRLMEGYDPAHLEPAPDWVVVGNVMSRGMPVIEYLLEKGLPYISGPQWLAEHLLRDRWVLAVAGTHGKTTTSAMLAWILQDAGLDPGFLIGGVPEDFGLSARFGAAPFFVVEADEYDTSFFDKRSKFVHYRPRTLILNNLEFDHADIFADLAAIRTQFHHLMRTVPGNGLVVSNGADANLDRVLEMGCWTPVERFGLTPRSGDPWSCRLLQDDGSAFEVFCGDDLQGRVEWSSLGWHNVQNALAAIAAARHAGVPVSSSLQALSRFRGVKRRMQVRGRVDGVTVYDDFAHHPTAVATTVHGLRRRIGGARLVAVLEPRSNTMRMGVHKDRLADALREADQVALFRPADMDWDLDSVAAELNGKARVYTGIEPLVRDLAADARGGDHILIMSNGAFGGIHERLLQVLRERSA